MPKCKCPGIAHEHPDGPGCHTTDLPMIGDLCNGCWILCKDYFDHPIYSSIKDKPEIHACEHPAFRYREKVLFYTTRDGQKIELPESGNYRKWYCIVCKQEFNGEGMTSDDSIPCMEFQGIRTPCGCRCATVYDREKGGGTSKFFKTFEKCEHHDDLFHEEFFETVKNHSVKTLDEIKEEKNKRKSK